MAKDTRLNIVVDNAQAIPAIDETGQAVENLRNKSRGATKESKKDWGGIADLFQSVLPRGISKTLRSFKSTTRQVGRLSKSFKFMRSAIISTGIGVLIVGLGEVLANWDKITEAIGLSDKAAEKNQKRYRDLQTEVKAYQDTIIPYLQTIADVNSSEQARLYAIEQINNKLGNVIDKEATRYKQRYAASELLYEEIKLIKKKNELDAINQSLAENAEEYQDASTKRRRVLREQTRILEDQQYEALRDVVAVEVEINQLLVNANKIREDRNELERKAAAATAKRKALALSNEKFLLNLEKDLREELLLEGIKDEEQRAQKELRLRYLEMFQKAEIAKATNEQLNLINEKFLKDRQEITDQYNEEEDPQEKIDDSIRVWEEVNEAKLDREKTEEQREIDAASAVFSDRFERANKWADLEKDALELFNLEKAEITDKWAKINAAKAKAVTDKEIDDAIALRRAKVSEFEKVGSAANMMFSAMRDAADENSAADKALAVTSILISQAVSIAKAIEAAVKVSAKAKNPSPFLFAANIAIMVGSVLKAFQGVKQILNSANTSSGSVGSDGGAGGGANPTVPLIPLGRQGSPDTNNQAYVVQSQLEGQNLNARQLEKQTVL